MFGSLSGGKISVSITGAANKVFNLHEIDNQSPNKLKDFDFQKLDISKINLNSDIHASAEYRSSLIKNMLPKLINKML